MEKYKSMKIGIEKETNGVNVGDREVEESFHQLLQNFNNFSREKGWFFFCFYCSHEKYIKKGLNGFSFNNFRHYIWLGLSFYRDLNLPVKRLKILNLPIITGKFGKTLKHITLLTKRDIAYKWKLNL